MAGTGRSPRAKGPRGVKTLAIRDASTIRALRTPLRQEILGVLERLGGASVRELAHELGRAPASLYYHVHALAEAGLIGKAGQRSSGSRTEAIYEPAADRIVIDRRGRSKEFIRALADLHSTTLRTAGREAVQSLEWQLSRGLPPDETVTLLRLSARLRPSHLRVARRKLKELAAYLAEHDDSDAEAAFAFTASLIRLVPREGGD